MTKESCTPPPFRSFDSTPLSLVLRVGIVWVWLMAVQRGGPGVCRNRGHWGGDCAVGLLHCGCAKIREHCPPFIAPLLSVWPTDTMTAAPSLAPQTTNNFAQQVQQHPNINKCILGRKKKGARFAWHNISMVYSRFYLLTQIFTAQHRIKTLNKTLKCIIITMNCINMTS